MISPYALTFLISGILSMVSIIAAGEPCWITAYENGDINAGKAVGVYKTIKYENLEKLIVKIGKIESLCEPVLLIRMLNDTSIYVSSQEYTEVLVARDAIIENNLGVASGLTTKIYLTKVDSKDEKYTYFLNGEITGPNSIQIMIISEHRNPFTIFYHSK